MLTGFLDLALLIPSANILSEPIIVDFPVIEIFKQNISNAIDKLKGTILNEIQKYHSNNKNFVQKIQKEIERISDKN